MKKLPIWLFSFSRSSLVLVTPMATALVVDILSYATKTATVIASQISDSISERLPSHKISLLTLSPPHLLAPFSAVARKDVTGILATCAPQGGNSLASTLIAIQAAYDSSNPTVQEILHVIIILAGICDVDEISRALPLPYPVRLHVFSIISAADVPRVAAIDRLCRTTGGCFYPVADNATSVNVPSLVAPLISTYYRPFHAIVQFGELRSAVTLHPPPSQTLIPERGLSSNLPGFFKIVSFVANSEIAAPPIISRHVLTPDDPEPNFAVLLEKSLAEGDMSALVMLADDWYGMLSSIIEAGSTYLVFAIFYPGNSAPWLPLAKEPGAGHVVAPSYELSKTAVYVKLDKTLESDVSKIVQTAKLLPEKKKVPIVLISLPCIIPSIHSALFQS